MTPNPPSPPKEPKEEITLTPPQQEEVTTAMGQFNRMREIHKRIKSLRYRNPYSNKSLRDEEIERLAQENDAIVPLYLAAYEKYPFLPH